MKKVLSLASALLLVAMVLSTFAFAAFAADEAENGILHRIHILVLIDVHLVKALAVLRRDGAR